MAPASAGSAIATAARARSLASRPAVRLVVGAAVAALSFYFVVHSAHFFAMTPEVLGKYMRLPWAIVGHIAGGMAALLMGPFQLSRWMRTRYRRAHRIMGRVYVVGVVVAGVCALTLASTTALTVGWPYALSLHMLATVWLVSTVLAWRTAVTKQMVRHEEWASRSYIATVAFVLQATTYEIPLIMKLGPIGEVAPTLIWLSWTVPMFAFDLLRRQPPLSARAAATAATGAATARTAAAPAAVPR